jgi:hypothetical protein
LRRQRELLIRLRRCEWNVFRSERQSTRRDARGEPIFGQRKTSTWMPQPPERFFEDAKYLYIPMIY